MFEQHITHSIPFVHRHLSHFVLEGYMFLRKNLLASDDDDSDDSGGIYFSNGSVVSYLFIIYLS